MIPLGSLFNVTTVIIGSIIGLFFNKYINADLNKFEMRTWELPNEMDVLERIKLKTLQREMNELTNE